VTRAERHREWRRKNRESVNARKREDYARNKDAINAKQREKRAQNPAAFLREREYSKQHREAYNALARAWRKKNPEKARPPPGPSGVPQTGASRGKSTYAKRREYYSDDHAARRLNVSRAEVQSLRASTGVCEICGEPGGAGQARLAIDHDHSTGELRGMLCRHCNAGLGRLKDSELLLSKAIMYLAKHRQKIGATG
jgi:hypothetical protein